MYAARLVTWACRVEKSIAAALAASATTGSPPMPPFTLVGLDHVVLLVNDMRRALDFYATILGCIPGYSYPALGMEQVWCGSALIVLWDITHPGAARAIPPVA
jgi:Glyoxalase/Bleomycin resistance protein/Dioxygenase superfamily